MNHLVKQGAYDKWHSMRKEDEPLQAKYWKARYGLFLDIFDWLDKAKYATVLDNPYYAVVNATAYCLKFGYFRGYEHFASVFFTEGSQHYVGLKVHKERTRTDAEHGEYVTDWYVEVTQHMTLNEHEQLYRAALGMLVACELRDDNTFSIYTQRVDHNIRRKDNGDQKAQIASH